VAGPPCPAPIRAGDASPGRASPHPPHRQGRHRRRHYRQDWSRSCSFVAGICYRASPAWPMRFPDGIGGVSLLERDDAPETIPDEGRCQRRLATATQRRESGKLGQRPYVEGYGRLHGAVLGCVGTLPLLRNPGTHDRHPHGTTERRRPGATPPRPLVFSARHHGGDEHRPGDVTPRDRRHASVEKYRRGAYPDTAGLDVEFPRRHGRG
jgi:hypothetical protein